MSPPLPVTEEEENLVLALLARYPNSTVCELQRHASGHSLNDILNTLRALQHKDLVTVTHGSNTWALKDAEVLFI